MPVCAPSCPDTASCRDSCGGLSCACPQGDVCEGSGACRPCVPGACRIGYACLDECGTPDPSCVTGCAQPDSCIDDCGTQGSAHCAGVECDPNHPGACLDTCGLYAANCCCAPTTCSDALRCDDNCGNFNPYQCQGRLCAAACEDTCGNLDGTCWSVCVDPTQCLDDCGNFNPQACAGLLCDPDYPLFDTCGNLDDNC